jgi:cell division protein FtsQ
VTRVRRGSGAGSARKPVKRGGGSPRRAAGPIQRRSAGANRLARGVFLAFLLAIGVVVVIALEIPAKVGNQAGEAVGQAGFRVRGYEITGLNNMARQPVDAIVSSEVGRSQPMVDVRAIRAELLKFGWVKDARVSRRLPDVLVIDIVEREPAALWQDKQQLALIDSEGVVLDRVPVDKMPDLPLLIGPGANAQAQELNALLAGVPTLKPQLASATWIGRRRWDLNFQSGETVALPEGARPASEALARFAKMDHSSGLLGRGILRFDLRIPGKMIARLPRAPGEEIAAETPSEG